MSTPYLVTAKSPIYSSLDYKLKYIKNNAKIDYRFLKVTHH